MANTKYDDIIKLSQSCNQAKLNAGELYHFKSSTEIDFIYIYTGTLTITYSSHGNTIEESLKPTQYIDLAYWKNTKSILSIKASGHTEIIYITYSNYISVIDVSDYSGFELLQSSHLQHYYRKYTQIR